MNKKIIIGVIVVLLVVLGIYYLVNTSKSVMVTNTQTVSSSTAENLGTPTTEPVNKEMTVIGKSVEGRDITAYHYGAGEKEVLFVGGVHGGYAWNTVAVAYKAMEYLKANPSVIPANVRVTIIPVVNTDGLFKVVGTTTANFTKANVSASEAIQTAGRFNGNNVDLNRNFDCDWQASATWQTKAVSGGTAAFSEPESLAVKNYIETLKPVAVVVWYSAAGGVFSSSCHNGVLAETNALTNTFAKASGYPAFEEFNYYEITGDMVNWLAKNKVPAISVLLTNHTDVEWSKNQAGILAVLKYIAK